jgi:hypothetical protein
MTLMEVREREERAERGGLVDGVDYRPLLFRGNGVGPRPEDVERVNLAFALRASTDASSVGPI